MSISSAAKLRPKIRFSDAIIAAIMLGNEKRNRKNGSSSVFPSDCIVSAEAKEDMAERQASSRMKSKKNSGINDVLRPIKTPIRLRVVSPKTVFSKRA